MLNWQRGKNRIVTKIIALVVVQAFLITNIGYTAPSDRSFFKNKKVDYKKIQGQREEALQQKKDTLSGKTKAGGSIYSRDKEDFTNRVKFSSLKDLSSIYIPDSLGRVVEVYQAPSGESRITNDERRLVVHIQDLHTNAEAQFNEASILEILIKDYGLGLVCSEGAEGEVDTSSVSSFPDPEVREKTARLFVDSGELTAEEYLSITKYPDLPIWGIEDKDVYFQNITEFNKIMKFSPDAQVFIQQAKEALERLRPEIYSKKLLEIDAKQAEYEEGELDTNEYLDYLLGLSKGIEIADKFKNISLLRESLEFEKAIDQQRIKEQSQRLLRTLQGILEEKQNRSEIQALATKAALFKDQKISPFSFYSYLDELARRHLKDDLERYQGLLDFVAYLEKVNSLDSMKLFQEIEELAYETKDLLSVNDNQKLLTRSLRHIKFLENFFNLKVSNEELDYYLANKESHKVNWFKNVITDLTPRQGSGQADYIDYNPDLIDMHLPELEHFYEIARERDIAMIDNAVSEIEKRNVKVATLIAGGFHTRGITQLLKEKGYSYVVISPYSSTDIDEENYQFLLSGKRKPISDLIDELNSQLRVPLGSATRRIEKIYSAGKADNASDTLSYEEPRLASNAGLDEWQSSLDLLLTFLEHSDVAFDVEGLSGRFNKLEDGLSIINPAERETVKSRTEELSPKERARMAYNIYRFRQERNLYPNLRSVFEMPEFYGDEVLSKLSIIAYMATYFSAEEINRDNTDFGQYELIEGSVKEGDDYIFIFRKGEERYRVRLKKDFTLESERVDSYIEAGESSKIVVRIGVAGSEQRRQFYTNLALDVHDSLKDTDALCATHSALIVKMLYKEHGIKAVIMKKKIEYDSHYWVQTEDGFIIDAFPFGRGSGLVDRAKELGHRDIIVIRRDPEGRLEKDTVERFYSDALYEYQLTELSWKGTIPAIEDTAFPRQRISPKDIDRVRRDL